MFEILLLSFALAMDAFAVSIGIGILKVENKKALALKVAFAFGFFQAFMPLLGFLGGKSLEGFIGDYTLLIAFILLILIGGKMLYEAFNEDEEDEIKELTNKALFILAIATSIDAMGAGFTLGLFSVNVYISLFLIGIITFFMSILGVYIGKKGGEKLEKQAEIFGAAVLIFIGLKFLYQYITI